MLYLNNAIASGMIPEGTMTKKYLTTDEVKAIVRCHDFTSCVGHENTAALFSSILSYPVSMNRVNVSLAEGDSVLVGEYSGPRLPEGATSLPEGATIRWCVYTIG